MAQIFINNRFKAAFPLFEEPDYRETDVSSDDLQLYTPTDEEFEDITLRFSSNKFIFASSGRTVSEDLLSGVIAPPPIISFSKSKKLIETKLQDDETVVVERWRTNQWQIQMQGILIDLKDHHYPSKLVKEMTKLFNYNGVVDVSGDLFDEKGITSLYFTSISFKTTPGFEDTVSYTLNAKSIKEVGFDLLNPI